MNAAVPEPGFDTQERQEDSGLIVDVDGFEGPLDLLLTLARNQKVDLRTISILALVEQYLAFINAARQMQLDLAADYLVMAAWLAYLKSRLLLPEPPGGPEPSAEDMAARLTLQLQRLELIRGAADRLGALGKLGVNFFFRPEHESPKPEPVIVQTDTLYDLLRAYGAYRGKRNPPRLSLVKARVFAIEDARHRLERMLGLLIDWNRLDAILPVLAPEPGVRRSAIASMLTASLEMARDGDLEIEQGGAFAPVFIRKRLIPRGEPAEQGEAIP
ncbi:MAG TPA: segregation/condensation protein A [Alphaproteobacteria bacterium]|nr:segregation/condensation protein A [Alphaproteobacteria bacterium]